MANQFDLTWTNDPAFDTLDAQAIESAAGEDVAFAFTLDTGTVNVTTWTVQFDVAPSDGRNPVLTIASGSISKGATGNLSFSVPKADTEAFPSRNYYWELLRTDAGNRKVLAFGNWSLTGSPSLYPGVTIPPTIIPLAKGGTGSDLSATGPAVIIQAAAEANLSALAADLSNTTLYLRKDLTWQLPTGSVPGTVTSVSVVTANGISGTVATATTTPAITLVLGAITPTSVNSVVISGSSTPTLVVTGSSAITGTNTGDQTNISGNAATVSVIDASADTTTWPMLATAQTGNLSPATDAGITYDATTNSLTLGVAGASLGSLVLAGNTSGYVQINTAAAAGSWTLTLPANNGDSGQFLQTDGNGVSSWATVSTTAAAITVANEATDTTCFVAFFTAATGDLGPKTNAALTFDSATANLGCTTFTGALVGNATTATVLATPRAIYGQNFDGSAALTGPATIATSTTTPKVIGGTTTTSTLTLQPTSGAGTTGADLIFAVGNNGATEAVRILNSGQLRRGSAPGISTDGFSTIVSDASAAAVIGNTHATGNGLYVGTVANSGATRVLAVCNGSGADPFNAIKFLVLASGNTVVGGTTATALFNVGDGSLFQVTSAGLVLLPAGASGAGNLALSTTGDTNTGLYFSAADTIAVQTGGVTALTIDSSQQATFAGKVFLPDGASGAGNLAISFTADTNTGLYRSAADEIAIQTGGVTAVTINSAQKSTFGGAVQVGASPGISTTGLAVIKSDASAAAVIGNSHATGSGLYVGTIANSGTTRALAVCNGSGADPFAAIVFLVESRGNVVCNSAAIATNATDGFLYIPTCAGPPTGTPTAFTGRAPLVIDSTNSKLYAYIGGAWVDLT